jgi:hypothetical protein
MGIDLLTNHCPPPKESRARLRAIRARAASFAEESSLPIAFWLHPAMPGDGTQITAQVPWAGGNL